MRPHFILLALIIALTAAQTRVAAQDEPCAQRLLPISLVGPDVSFLRGFSVSDIALKSRAPGLEALSIQPDTRMRRVVILLDVSASMSGQSSRPWSVVIDFFSHIAGVNAKNTHFALVLFSDHILETIDFSQDRGAVHRRLDKISKDPEFIKRDVRGRTALFDALQTAFHLIDSPTSADSLFVITDGGDNVSKTRSKDILKMLSPSMVRIFTLLFEHRIYMNRVSQDSSSTPDFLALVHDSGGSSFGPVIVDETGHFALGNPYLLSRPVSDSLLEFYRSMLENPVFAVRGTSASNNSTSLDIALSKEGREHWKNATLLYPHQIISCPIASAIKN
jgi:hypothetical protein